MSTLIENADDECPGDLGSVYYLVRHIRSIVYVDVTPGVPIRVRRYPHDDDLLIAWAAIVSGDEAGWVQGVDDALL